MARAWAWVSALRAFTRVDLDAGAGRLRRARVVILLSAAAAFAWLAWSSTSLPPHPGGPLVREAGVKYILLWNEYFHYENLGFGPGHGKELFARAECPQRQCFLTADRSLMAEQEFDAVVFHMYYFSVSLLPFLNWRKFPSARSPHQRYIFFLLETPFNCGSSYRRMSHLFNWTMTYRQDSDVVAPYGQVTALPGAAVPARGWVTPHAAPITPAAVEDALRAQRHSQSNTNTRRRRRGRREGGEVETAAVAWLVSHCATQSRREELVARLSMHIPVHVYGDCGSPWPKDDLAGFHRMLTANYRFYLSFENSLCRDYVTEKLFKILPLDVVPVVYGGANYSAVVPPHSYIDANAFATPRHLAEYLQYLLDHPEEYNKFFWWKKYYSVATWPMGPICQLCEKLHEKLPSKSYADMEQWWGGEGICREPEISLTDFLG